MLPVPSDASDRDIVRWLSQVFLYVDGDKQIPLKLYGVERRTVLGEVLVGAPTEPRIRPCEVSKCFAHWPRLGTFNPPNRSAAVYISRKTTRQWDRSLTAGVLSVTRLELMPGRARLYAPQYVEVPYIHDPYMTAIAAQRAVESGQKESVAINHRVAIGQGLCTYKNAVFVDGELAATLINRELLLTRPDVSQLLLKTFGEGYALREPSDL